MSQETEGHGFDFMVATGDIVAAYVSHNHVAAADLPHLIATVHQSLGALGSNAPAVQEETVEKPSAAQVRKSIQPDAIISFEDGKPYKALRRHLTLRGLTPETYRAKWGLPVDYPMVCATYSARRSEISREISVGQQQRAKIAGVLTPRAANDVVTPMQGRS